MTCETCGGNRTPELCKLCEMFAAGRPPSIQTEATFQAGAKLGGDQFGPRTRGHYLRAAAEAGVSTDGKVYDGRLAEFPGDPRAWIANKDDTRRVCEERGWGCSGDVTVKAEPVAPPPPVALAEDIRDDLVEDRLAAQYGEDFTTVKTKDYEDAVGSVEEKHGLPAHLRGSGW